MLAMRRICVATDSASSLGTQHMRSHKLSELAANAIWRLPVEGVSDCVQQSQQLLEVLVRPNR